ncbi:MAG: DoxX family protein [Candidatus Omnitrophica bacterium]|nr:DoxX family protein [Candidatus Omnitrophota bacterium]
MILNRLNKYRDTGLLILRIGLGIMFIYHGLPKMCAGLPMWTKLGAAVSNVGINFGFPFWGFMSAFAELIGGVCLILGLLFRPFCFFLVINMIVAAAMHLKTGQGMAAAAWPIEDGIVFLSLLLIGPGRFSLDEKL